MSFFVEEVTNSADGDESIVVDSEYEEAKREWEATVSRLDDVEEVNEEDELSEDVDEVDTQATQ